MLRFEKVGIIIFQLTFHFVINYSANYNNAFPPTLFTLGGKASATEETKIVVLTYFVVMPDFLPCIEERFDNKGGRCRSTSMFKRTKL